MQCLRLQTQHPNASLLYLGISTMSLQLYQHSSREFRTLDLLYAEGCLVPVPNKACPGISNSYNRWCCQLINYLERLALYGTCLKLHWTPFSLQSYMSHSVMHNMGASQAPVLHLFTLYTSDSGRTSGPATCSGSRMTLHLWAVSVRGRRLSARTRPTPPSVWGDPPAANTDRTKELVVDLCRQKTPEM